VVSILFAINNPLVQELMARSPMPISMQYGVSFLGLIISICAGAFMLKGANWARILYMGWGAFGLLFGLLTSPLKLMLIVGALVYGVFAFFLLAPKASAYFTASLRAQDREIIDASSHVETTRVTSPTPHVQGHQTTGIVRTVLGITVLVVSGFFFYSVALLAFINQPISTKTVIITTFATPAVIFLLIGVWLHGFSKFRFDLGIVLLAAVGNSLMAILSYIYVLATPELAKQLPPDGRQMFSAVWSGAICLLAYLAVGIALILLRKRSAPV
jgi:hypothetical protein